MAVVAAAALVLVLPFAFVAPRGIATSAGCSCDAPPRREPGRLDPARRAPARNLRADDLPQLRRLVGPRWAGGEGRRSRRLADGGGNAAHGRPREGFRLPATVAATVLTRYTYNDGYKRSASGRADELGDVRAQRRPRFALLLAGPRAPGAGAGGCGYAHRRRHDERPRAAVTRTSPASKRAALPTTRTWNCCLQAGEPQPP
jgi:hypothetical protein